MPNNIFTGPNNIVAKPGISTDFLSAGISSGNTAVIYKRSGSALVSFKPGRTVNAFVAFEPETGYYFVALANLDLTAYVVPPVPPALQPVGTPTAVTATPVGGGAISVSFSSPGGVDAVAKIDMATDPDFTANYEGAVGSGGLVTALTPGTHYYFRISFFARGYAPSAFAYGNAIAT